MVACPVIHESKTIAGHGTFLSAKPPHQAKRKIISLDGSNNQMRRLIINPNPYRPPARFKPISHLNLEYYLSSKSLLPLWRSLFAFSGQ